MKKTFLIALTLLTNFVFAQTQLSDYYDARSANRQEFSYNIVVKIHKTTGATEYDTRYTATLVQASPDSKGFYNAYGDNKYYSCSQLGDVCKPNNLHLISVRLSYTCNGQQKADVVTFRNLNDVEQINTVYGAGGKLCESLDFSMKVMGAVIEPIHLGQIMNKINQIGTTKTTQNNTNSNNQSTQTNSKGTQTNETKSYELKLSDIGIAEINSSTKSEYQKNYETGQQISDAVTPIANDLVDAWNKRVDRKNAEIIAYAKADNARRDHYNAFCENYAEKLKDLDFYMSTVIDQIPSLLRSNSPSWESILGDKKLADAFGKDREYIIDNYSSFEYKRNIQKSRMSKVEYGTYNNYKIFMFSQFYAANLSCHASYKYDYILNGKKANTFLIKHTNEFIYNDSNKVIGVLLHIPFVYSTYTIEEFYKDIKTKVGNNYIMLGGNIFLMKDKLIILDYKKIMMYDLNSLNDKVSIELPPYYYHSKHYKKLGLGFKLKEETKVTENGTFENTNTLATVKSNTVTYEHFLTDEKGTLIGTSVTANYKNFITDEKGTIIGSIEKDGLADKAGLKVDDIITSINGIKISAPYILQLFVQGYPIGEPLYIIYLRNGIVNSTIINF